MTSEMSPRRHAAVNPVLRLSRENGGGLSRGGVRRTTVREARMHTLRTVQFGLSSREAARIGNWAGCFHRLAIGSRWKPLGSLTATVLRAWVESLGYELILKAGIGTGCLWIHMAGGTAGPMRRSVAGVTLERPVLIEPIGLGR